MAADRPVGPAKRSTGGAAPIEHYLGKSHSISVRLRAVQRGGDGGKSPAATNEPAALACERDAKTRAAPLVGSKKIRLDFTFSALVYLFVFGLRVLPPPPLLVECARHEKSPKRFV
jgi:hypothetical protein